MEFLTERCYTALNADELKFGSKVICAFSIAQLKERVEKGERISEVRQILSEDVEQRIKVYYNESYMSYPFAYLVSTPKEKNWIVYLHRGSSNPKDYYYLTACRSDRWETVKEDCGAKTKLFEGTEDECENWYTSRRQFADIIAAWEDGKTIQYNSGNGWEDCCNNRPVWNVTIEYRIKPEGLKWTDLKIGDIIRKKHEDGYRFAMVIRIDTYSTEKRIGIGAEWLTYKGLEEWEKVE